MARGSIADLLVTLGVDFGSFSADFDKATNVAKRELLKISSIGNAVGNLASSAAQAAVAGVKNTIANVVTETAKLQDIADRAGVSIEKLSAQRLAAAASDTSLESYAKALQRLSTTALKAAEDGGKLPAVFKSLGIELVTSTGAIRDSTAVFDDIVARLSALPKGAEQTALAVELLGKKLGPELLPLIQNGTEGLAEFERKTRDLQGVLNEADGQAVAAFGDQLDELGESLNILAQRVLVDALPALSELAKITLESVQNGSIKQLGEFIVAAANAVSFLTEKFVAFKNSPAFEVLERLSGISTFTSAAEVLGNLAAQAPATPQTPTGVVGAYEAAASSVTNFYQKAQAEVKRLQAEELAAVAKKIAADKTADAAREAAAKNARAAAKAAAAEANALANAQRSAADNLLKSLERQLTPLAVLRKEYEANKKAFQAQYSGPELQRALDLLSRNYKRQLDETKKLKDAEQERADKAAEAARKAFDDIDAEIALVRRLTEAKLKGGNAYELELELSRRVKDLKDLNNNGLADEIALLEKKLALLIKERATLSETLPPAETLGEAFRRAVEVGTKTADLSAFISSLTKGVAQAFSKNPLGATADLLSLAAANAEGFRGNTSDVVRSTAQLLAQTNIPIVSTVARIASAIDSLAGGRLFGTRAETVRSGFSVSVGAGGVTGNSIDVTERQRALFGGRDIRTVLSALGADLANGLRKLLESVRAITGEGARLLGVSAPPLIEGAFKEIKDKAGKVIEQFSTFAGERFNESFEAYQKRLTAVNIIAVVEQASQGAAAIAARWKDSAEKLLEGAQFLLSAQADIQSGLKLLGSDSTLANVTAAVERFSFAGETLSETYARVRGSFQLVTDSLAGIGAQAALANTALLDFAVGLVDALGGLDIAGPLVQRVTQEFFTEAERASARLAAAQRARDSARAPVQASLDALGLTALLDNIPALITRALSGAFPPELAASILEYADAQALVNSVQRDAAGAAREAAEAQRAAATAYAAASTALAQSLRDFGATDFQRALSAADAALSGTLENLSALAKEAGLAAPDVRDVANATELYRRQVERAQRELTRTVLGQLIALVGDAPELTDAQRATQGYNNVLRGLGPVLDVSTLSAQRFRTALAALEKQDAALTLSANLGDVIRRFSGNAAAAFASLEIDADIVRKLLTDAGVSLTAFNSPQSLAAFGQIAKALGISAEKLAELSGVDLSNLTPEQRALIESQSPAVDLAKTQAGDIGALKAIAEREELAALQRQQESVSLQLDLVAAVQTLRASQETNNAILRGLSEALARQNTARTVGV